mmetsp:Transcript_43309/g.94261  ORF Transcript_43309/g.94261 Transcript_43309/m.94261 type:complete len:365 (+) Transcript_43309:137-1231(+)
MQLAADMTPSERWSLGLLMAILNCALSSVGFIMQRKSQLMEEAELQRERESESDGATNNGEDDCKRKCCWIWIVGVMLYIFAAVPDLIAYTMVPQVVCTTVACFRLVVVTGLGHLCLKEKVQCREMFGMLMCTVGTCCCLLFSPLPEQLQESDGAAGGIFHHPQVLVYLGMCLAVLLAMLAAEFTGGHDMHFILLPAATGLAFALEKVFNTEIGFVDPRESALPWVGMAAAIAVLGLADFGLNLRGATRMPPQVFLPISFTLSTTLQYFQSVVIFGEFNDMDPLAASLSVCSAAVALFGALLIRPPSLDHCVHHQILKDTEEELMNATSAEDLMRMVSPGRYEKVDPLADKKTPWVGSAPGPLA